MNSPPRSRYSAASAPMTPTSDSALEIGCVWTTRLIPQTTAIAAKMRKSSASILCECDQQARNEQVDQRNWEHECPGEAHQLVIAESRQRRTHPDEHEQNDPDLCREPEQRHQ